MAVPYKPPTPPLTFRNHEFRTRSGSWIKNPIPLPLVSEESEKLPYRVDHYQGFEGCATVFCAETSRKSANGRSIFVTPEGIEFVYVYRGASPYWPDEGILAPPKYSKES